MSISSSVFGKIIRCSSNLYIPLPVVALPRSCCRGMDEGKMLMKEDEEDSYVGRTVKKFFLGFGYFHGKVIAFNRARKFYKVKYDDGDREELDFKELEEVLVDDQQPLPSSERSNSTRRGRKRRRDSAERNGTSGAGISVGTGERQNFARKEIGDRFSPVTLEEVRVLNAQSQEIYRQLRGDDSESGKNGRPQGDELLLEPLVPVCLVSAFEKSVNQAELEFDQHGEDEEKTAVPFANPILPMATTSSPCRIKRTRVSPTSETSLQQVLPVKDEETGPTTEDVGTVKVEETAMKTGETAPPPVVTEADSPPLGVSNNNSDAGTDGNEGGDQKEEKTHFSAFVLSLPPSSRSLGALDDCVADFFQVYSLLRSFSSTIFLSPFSLEEFAYSLLSTDTSSLIDCVHLSLLQSLRRQLERLSRSGSKAATFTLRLSDWTLLDYITWPSFLMGYMLTQGFNFDHRYSYVKAGLTSTEYYKLPVGTKLAILSFLCDKVLDTEEARAELTRRIILENDPETMESKVFPQKKQVKESTPDVVELDSKDTIGTGKEALAVHVGAQEAVSPSGANSIRVGRHLDEDGNLDECVLCAMDGNLICCDGCPAAYHSRCVGVTKQGLPPGDWFCPECRADKHDPRGARISKGVRGGELLAIGTESQLFYNICGYLLISEAGPNGKVMHRYYSRRDLQSVVKLLEEAGPSYSEVINAFLQLCQAETGVTMPTDACLKAPVLEMSASLVPCSESEVSHHEQLHPSSSTMPGGCVPAEVEKPFRSSESTTPDWTKKLNLPVSHSSSTIENSEPLASTHSLHPKEEHEEKRNLLGSASLKQVNAVPGDVPLEVESIVHNSDSLISVETKNLDLPVSCPSTVANGDPLRSGLLVPPKEDRQEKQHDTDYLVPMNGLQSASDAVIPRVCRDEARKVSYDEPPACHFMDDSISAELEQIWRQHTSGNDEYIAPPLSRSESNEQMTADESDQNAGQFIDALGEGFTVVRLGSNAPLNCSGDVEHGKISSQSIAQPMPNADVAAKAVVTCPDKLFSKQLEKRAAILHHEIAGSEKEVDYLSTITQINACSYRNQYANCDLVATSAFNLAVMAGGIDDLVDDKTGPTKKSKPSSVSDQMKAFGQASPHFYWPTIKKRAKDVPKGKCGWCINCRSTGRRGCLLTQVAGGMAGGSALVVGGIRPIKGGSGHFPAVAAYILYMEENLHGLLVGAWEFSGHRKKWRKEVELAKSVKDIKLALLQMESSMRKVALSPDWDKVEQDAPESITSSAIIISTPGATAGKKAAPTKKRGRPSVVAKTPSANSYDGACFGVKWWRGGSLSRRVYNWESLSKTALRRAGRQGGFKEIPELVYSKSFDLPRRTRRFAWRTRMEKISSIAQVAVEVRFLDSFIRWNDIISPLEASTTHNVKGSADSDPAFHKAEIRAKKEENGVVKYVLSFPTDTNEAIDASTQPEVPAKGSVEKPNNKKHQAAPKEIANEVAVIETQVPLFLLKAFVEKMRTENQSELPKSLKKKKGTFKGSSQQKLSFWKMLCSPRLSGVLESKKLSGWVCGHCKLNGTGSQRVRCQRCTGDFHKSCTQVEDSINGQDKVPVCKSCIQLRVGPRMRKPSYKMLVMQSELSDGSPNGVANMDGASTGSVSLRLKKGRRADSTSPPDYELFGRKKKKKRLLSMPTPSQLHCESPYMEEKKGKKLKKKKKRTGGFTTVVPLQYEGEPIQVGRKSKKKKGLSMTDKTDQPRPKKKVGRIKKIVALDKKQDTPPSQERRTSGRIRNIISPNTAMSLAMTEYQSPRRVKKKYKLSKEVTPPEKYISTRRRSGQMKDSLAAAETDDDGKEVPSKPSQKRKRLKIIFDGLEVAGRDLNDSGGHEEDGPRKRKSANGLDFGGRSAKSEADVQRFRRERVVLEDQVLLDQGKLPRCGICSQPYASGHLYVGCEYCDGWYHGIAVGLSQGDAAYLMGYKCHRCRKCRAPSCPVRQNNTGVKTRRRGAVDHGEVIDAENVNRTGQFETLSLQSSWFNSPDKEFSGFNDSKALPDFVSATNQAEEALAADGSNFGHDVLSHDFDISDLVLTGVSQVQLNPLSLEGQEWANNDSSQIDLPPFSVSQADLSSQAATSLSFTELLASEDDIFDGVTATGLALSAEWSGAIYGTDTLGPLKAPAADVRLDAKVDNYSSVANSNGNMSTSGTPLLPLKPSSADMEAKPVLDSYPSLVSASDNLLTHLKADTTTNVGVDSYSSIATAKGNACGTTLPVVQCGKNSYDERSLPLTPLTMVNGDKGMVMGRSAVSG